VGVRVGVESGRAKFFFGQSIGIDEINFFLGQSIGFDENIVLGGLWALEWAWQPFWAVCGR